MDGFDDSSFFDDNLYSPDDNLSLSTVDANLNTTQSQPASGSSTAASIVNALGQYGVVIASLVSNTPIATARDASGRIVPVGTAAAQALQQQQQQTNFRLLIVVGAALGIAAIFAFRSN